MSATIEYERFIESKHIAVRDNGFSVHPDSLNPRAFDWQRVAASWAIKRGRCAFLEECGLGKTLQSLLWGEQIVLRERRPILLLCPIGVRSQTIAEAKRFDIGIPVVSANDRSEVQDCAINVTNYEKLHKFDTDEFVGVILDESSVLKEFKSKTKRDLCARFVDTPYRLACTATPAPNEWMELGCHAEFLGVMSGSEMLSRWFLNDTMRSGEYRLLSHAADDFWRWMCGWALCLSRPSDMGSYSDAGYILPPVDYRYEFVEVESEPCNGTFWAIDKINVHTMHKQKRHTCQERAARARDIVRSKESEHFVVWCDTDYEADALKEAIPEAIEVRGSHSDKRKELTASWFVGNICICQLINNPYSPARSCICGHASGRRILICKPDMFGLGVNFQHCSNVVFVGLTYSFERFYQAVRRSWRFGQKRPVTVWVVQSDAEEAITNRVLEKQKAHQAMQASLADAMRKTQIDLLQGDLALSKYLPKRLMEVPSWLRSK